MENSKIDDSFFPVTRRGALVDLMKVNPMAVCLLMVIASRVSTEDNEITGLRSGSCWIGDFRSYGMTEGQYRGAKKTLVTTGQIRIRVTGKGTVAELISKAIIPYKKFDQSKQLNRRLTGSATGAERAANGQLTDAERAANGRLTTNKIIDIQTEEVKIIDTNSTGVELVNARESKKTPTPEKNEPPETPTPEKRMKLYAEDAQIEGPHFTLLLKKIVRDTGLEPVAVRAQLKAFFAYWTEPTRDGKRQKWQKQETFELSRRLVTWFSNASKWAKEAKEGQKWWEEPRSFSI